MELFAAIDVGSNSVRLQIAAFVSGFQHQVVREERVVTRLGAQVFHSGELSEKSIRDTVDALKKFKKLADEAGVVRLRAVGTSALRDANNSKRFFKLVRREADLEIDIVSGHEEGRMIHMGVMSRIPNPDDALMLIDIGGGSAEFTLSKDQKLVATSTGPFGAVRLTEMFIEDDPPKPPELERLESFIQQKLKRVSKTLNLPGRKSWKRVIGTSGTMAALAGATKRVDAARTHLDGQTFTRAEAEPLYKRLCTMKEKARAEVSGVNAKRAEIIIAGAAVVVLAMRDLDIDEITYSDAGLRDGVLIDLAARHKRDPRGLQFLTDERLQSVEALAEHYGETSVHSKYVARLARDLFHVMQPVHQLDDSYGVLLEAAALLHNVGHYVNASKHHKHSFYLIANSDLPGYTELERLLIANVARYHRGAPPSMDHDGFQLLPYKERKPVEKLAALLRLADACDNSRKRVVESVLATPRDGKVELRLLSSAEAQLERWAAEKCAPIFRDAFDRKLSVEVQTMKPA